MFYHAYNAYMSNAYPADELMPLSCKGRYRGSEPDRGDIDSTLGKLVLLFKILYQFVHVCLSTLCKINFFYSFSLTLVDTLDTLVVSYLIVLKNVSNIWIPKES